MREVSVEKTFMPCPFCLYCDCCKKWTHQMFCCGEFTRIVAMDAINLEEAE